MSENTFKHNEPHIHEINTGEIFQKLEHGDKWKSISRPFLVNIFQEALENTLIRKGVLTVKYNGENGDYLNNYREHRYPQHLKMTEENENRFPFPNYFLYPDTDNHDYMNIINFGEPCLVYKGEYYYDTFFALQFYVTDIVKDDLLEADEFLQYHFDNTFNKNLDKFTIFLDRICLKYNEFLKDKYEPLARRFIQALYSKQTESQETLINRDITHRIKLNWKGQSNALTYLFRQLKTATNKKGEPVISNSYEEIARFIQDNFEGFDELKLSTLLGQFKNTDKPKKVDKKIELYI